MAAANREAKAGLQASVSDGSCLLPAWPAVGTTALQKLLEPDLLGVLGLNPAAQIIRQRGVHPIAARTQNFDFTARRQRENAVCRVGCGEARLNVVARHDGKPTPFAPVVERVNRPHGYSAHEEAQD